MRNLYFLSQFLSCIQLKNTILLYLLCNKSIRKNGLVFTCYYWKLHHAGMRLGPSRIVLAGTNIQKKWWFLSSCHFRGSVTWKIKDKCINFLCSFISIVILSYSYSILVYDWLIINKNPNSVSKSSTWRIWISILHYIWCRVSNWASCCIRYVYDSFMEGKTLSVYSVTIYRQSNSLHRLQMVSYRRFNIRRIGVREYPR